MDIKRIKNFQNLVRTAMLLLTVLTTTGAWAQTTVSLGSKLIEAIDRGDENIQLTDDIRLDNYLDINGKTLTIDLNGYSISRVHSYNQEDGHVIEVRNSGNLTLTSTANDYGIIKGGRTVDGGAIHIQHSGTVNANHVTFQDNTASNHAGAIWNNGTFTANDCKFENNTASDVGAIYNAKTNSGCGISTLTNCTFIGNQGTTGAGALANALGATVMIIEGCTISGNTASGHGGGIWNGGTLTVTNSIFTNNTAYDVGGIYNAVSDDGTIAGTATLTGCTFTGNKGTNGAGALANAIGATEMTIDGCTIRSNTAGTNGGGIWNGGTLKMKGKVTVTGNKKASGESHNVFLKSGKFITLIGSLTGSVIGVDVENYPCAITSSYATYHNGTRPNDLFISDHSSAYVNIWLGSNNEVCMATKSMKYYDTSITSGSRMKMADMVIPVSIHDKSIGNAKQTTWYYADGDIINNNRIEVKGTVNLILGDGCLFRVNAGLKVEQSGDLNIYAQSAGDGCGKLEAYYKENNVRGHDAAIGGDGGVIASSSGMGHKSGPITIYGGDINASSIGGGCCGRNSIYGYLGAPGDCALLKIYGGRIHVDEYIGASDKRGVGTVKLGWSDSSDRIFAKNYYANNQTVVFMSEFTDDKNTNLSSYVEDDASISVVWINNTTLLPKGTMYNVNIVGDYDPPCLTGCGSQIMEKDYVTLSATNGYSVSAITVKTTDNTSVPVTNNGNGTWSFFMPSSDVNITPVVSPRNYYLIYKDAYVNINTDNTDTQEQEGIISYKSGQTIRFTVDKPAENYELQYIDLFKTGDENDKIDVSETNDEYSFAMPAHDVTLSPSWRIVGYNINKPDNMTLEVSEEGSLTINEHTYYKEDITVTVTVNIPQDKILSGFSVNNDYRDGAAVPFTDNGDGTFTFTMPNGDVTLSAVYELDLTRLKLLTGLNDFTTTDGSDKYSRPSSGYECLLDGKYSAENNNYYSKWCVGEFQTGHFYATNPCYVEFNTTEPVVPKFYTLITGNDNAQYARRNPKDWKMMAKLNESDEWTVIAEVTNDEQLQDVNYTTYLFDFDNEANDAYMYFRFEITSNQGDSYMQLSELQMWVKDGLVLADNADNIAVIINNNNETTDVTLMDRKLWKDGKWNTLCLPFSLTQGQIAESPLADADIRTLSSASFASGTLTLNFTEAGEVTSITAGTPYIVKWTEQTPDYVENPVFNGVTISNSNDPIVTEFANFVGTFSPLSIAAEGDNTLLFLGDDDTLYYPNNAMSIGSCRAYFQLNNGLVAGDRVNGINNFVLNFGGESSIENVPSSIFNLQSEGWYTLDGRKLSGVPTQKGIYINNGKKVVIK